MHHDICHPRYAAFYSGLYPEAYIMGFVNVHIGANLNMQVDVNIVYPAAGPYLMAGLYALNSQYDIRYLIIIRYDDLIAQDFGAVLCDRKTGVRYK